MFTIAKKQWSTALCLITLLLLWSFILYHNTKKSVQSDTIRTRKYTRTSSKQHLKDDISCHDKTESDALPSAEESSFSPPADTIFFHETSCGGGLNSRQACAIESAAKAHPGRKVYVLFSGPISENVLNSTRCSFFALRRYVNIEFARVHVDKYAKGTAIEKLFKHQLRVSWWKVIHTSDLLRIITMYKYGGIYMDMDVIVVKPLDDLGRNWVAKQNFEEVNGAVMNVAKDQLGQSIMRELLEEIKRSYNPNSWSYNGPEALSRVLQRICNTTNVEEFSNATCQGFKIYEPEVIYPVPHPNFKKLFEPGALPNTEKAYSFHLWNYLSQDTEVQMDSPVESLAEQYCPVVHELYEDSFGFV